MHVHAYLDERRPGYYLADPLETDDPRYPFQRVIFANGTNTGVLALIAPFYADAFHRVRFPLYIMEILNDDFAYTPLY